MASNINDLRGWIGRTESQIDEVNPVPVAALSATLDRDVPFPRVGDPLPPLWHWLYFLPVQRQSEIEPDGLTKRGGFLPPVPLPRLMYAGNRQEFKRTLRIGDRISRTSSIADVISKEGRSGPLVFVLVRHEIHTNEGLVLTEEQELVYREHSKPGDPVSKPQSAPGKSSWSREISPDEVLLFRFSALTFNSHRIHYDRQYATQVEGYADLVVQGRLIVILLVDLLMRNIPNARIDHFSSRALRPLFVGAPFTVCGQMEGDGKTVRLWAADVEGWLATDATAILA
jgi:3-methylfumaryl-CoA hydratase